MLETKLDSLEDRVERLDGKVDGIDAKLDTVLLELAKKPEQSKGWTLSKAAQQAIGGVIGAVLLYLAASLGLPLPSSGAPTPAATAESTP